MRRPIHKKQFDIDSVWNDVVSHISLRYGEVSLEQDDYGGRLYLQVHDEEGRSGRKWYLSPHMTESEIVRTAFAAALAFEEHELRETFEYKNVAVFNPHIDVNVLVKVANKQDRRRDTRGSWERED